MTHSTGADPGFFLGGGVLISCSTSTPINLMVILFIYLFIYFFRIPVVLGNRRSSQGGVCTPCTLSLDPPLFHPNSCYHILQLQLLFNHQNETTIMNDNSQPLVKQTVPKTCTSCFMLRRGIQTPPNDKSTRPLASCFHLFLSV